MTPYAIPVNYTDAGRLFGLFEIRNTIEAALLSLPILYLCLRFLPMDLSTKVIVTMTLFIPVAGFGLMGLADESLLRYLNIWGRFCIRRRILTYRGEIMQREFERAYVRRG